MDAESTCDVAGVTVPGPVTPALSRAEKVEEIDRNLSGLKADFMDVTHTFGPGIYTRSATVAAGRILIGAKHRVANVFHLHRGKVIVWDADNGIRLLSAPYSEITPPGRQRLGLVVEEIECCNILTTTATTPDEVEREMLFPFHLPANPGELVMQMTEKLLS